MTLPPQAAASQSGSSTSLVTLGPWQVDERLKLMRRRSSRVLRAQKEGMFMVLFDLGACQGSDVTVRQVANASSESKHADAPRYYLGSTEWSGTDGRVVIASAKQGNTLRS